MKTIQKTIAFTKVLYANDLAQMIALLTLFIVTVIHNIICYGIAFQV